MGSRYDAATTRTVATQNVCAAHRNLFDGTPGGHKVRAAPATGSRDIEALFRD